MSEKQDMRIIADALATNDGEHISRLALSCYYGRGRDKNLKAALKLWERAAELENAEAMYYLGVCRCYGDGTPRDKEAAFALWERAAALGHDGARISLANLRGDAQKPDDTDGEASDEASS